MNKPLHNSRGASCQLANLAFRAAYRSWQLRPRGQFLGWILACASLLGAAGGCSQYGYGTTPLRERWRANRCRNDYPLAVYADPWPELPPPVLEKEDDNLEVLPPPRELKTSRRTQTTRR